MAVWALKDVFFLSLKALSVSSDSAIHSAVGSCGKEQQGALLFYNHGELLRLSRNQRLREQLFFPPEQLCQGI